MKRFGLWIIPVVALLGLFTPAAGAGDPDLDFDLLFVNGKVIDGTGNPWFYADVGVRAGRIAAVGRFRGRARAGRTIDLTGRIICPGFIDIHDHAFDQVADEKSWAGEDDPRFFAPNFVSQGITTVVSNQCGHGPVDIGTQAAALTRRGTGPNVMLMIGHNNVRRRVMGRDQRRPASSEEIGRMRALVRRAMEDGAAGLSAGLEYVPCIWSETEETVALVKEIVPFGGVYIAHERASGLTPMWYVPSRDEPGPPNMLDNIRELIEVGRRTGATVVATHIKARGADFWGASGAIIHHIQEARNQGVDIWADCYPYTSSGSDGNTVLLPEWALGDRPVEKLNEALADPEKSRDLRRDIAHNLNWRGGADNILIMDYPDPNLVGKSLGEAARARGVEPAEMAILLQKEGFPDRPGGARLRGFSMHEIDIEAFYAQPWCATCTDGSIALPEDGPVHARFYGTFPRKIRRYAMERKVITLEEAVRTSTSLPAQILGLRDRGLLREGFHADLVVFDPRTIRDAATFFEPHRHSQGVDFVLINGSFAVDEGKLTWERKGAFVTR